MRSIRELGITSGTRRNVSSTFIGQLSLRPLETETLDGTKAPGSDLHNGPTSFFREQFGRLHTHLLPYLRTSVGHQEVQSRSPRSRAGDVRSHTRNLRRLLQKPAEPRRTFRETVNLWTFSRTLGSSQHCPGSVRHSEVSTQ